MMCLSMSRFPIRNRHVADDGVAEIPIEEREQSEVTHLLGRTEDGDTIQVKICPDGVPAANPALMSRRAIWSPG